MTLKRLAQDPKSGDCGYFSGYAAYMKFNHGAGCGVQAVTQHDVYRARNNYWVRHIRREDPGMVPAKMSQGLNYPRDMVTYLTSLGLRGYTGSRAKVGGFLQNPAELRSLLRTRASLPGNRSSLLLGINNPSLGHWIAVLGRSRSTGSASKRPMLKWGSRGDLVKALQKTLNSITPTQLAKLGEDGIFGRKTYGRVREYQKNTSKLKVDGVVGPKTWAALDAYISESIGIVYALYNSASPVGGNLFAIREGRLVKALAHNGVFYVVAHRGG
jgi:hypothetical protein